MDSVSYVDAKYQAMTNKVPAGINMVWGATSKEKEFSNFFIEVPKVLKRFKFSILFAIVGIVGMVVLATADFVPWDWRIRDFTAILPMVRLCIHNSLTPLTLPATSVRLQSVTYCSRYVSTRA